MAKVKYPLQPFKEPMSLKRGKTQVDGLRLASAKYLIGWGGRGVGKFSRPIKKRTESKALQSHTAFNTQLKIVR